MKKSQWYVMSVASFLLSLFFGAMSRNRKNICDAGYEIVRDYCMQRHTVFVLFGVILLVASITFLLLGIFEKGKN